jgi:hypothetical protein
VEPEALLGAATEALVELEPGLAVELAPALDVRLALAPIGALADCAVVVPVGSLGDAAPGPHAHATPVPPANVRTAVVTANGFV